MSSIQFASLLLHTHLGPESDGLRPPQHGRSMKGTHTGFTAPMDKFRASSLNLNDKTIALGYRLKLLISKRWSTPSALEWFRELYLIAGIYPGQA